MLEKWTAERKDAWKTEGKAEMVLKAMRKKFNTIPEEIEQSVLAMSDPVALESVLEHVFDGNTLEEFATVL